MRRCNSNNAPREWNLNSLERHTTHINILIFAIYIYGIFAKICFTHIRYVWYNKNESPVYRGNAHRVVIVVALQSIRVYDDDDDDTCVCVMCVCGCVALRCSKSLANMCFHIWLELGEIWAAVSVRSE